MARRRVADCRRSSVHANDRPAAERSWDRLNRHADGGEDGGKVANWGISLGLGIAGIEQRRSFSDRSGGFGCGPATWSPVSLAREGSSGLGLLGRRILVLAPVVNVGDIILFFI